MYPILDLFDSRFKANHSRSIELVKNFPEHRIFDRPADASHQAFGLSFGESILRAAAEVERAVGGITTRLWDDPFEWTLPETLSNRSAIVAYIDEVESRRQHAFLFFTSDDDLQKQIPAPEELRSLYEIMLDSLIRSEHFIGRSIVFYQLFSNRPSGPG
jgi:hypothetical protein